MCNHLHTFIHQEGQEEWARCVDCGNEAILRNTRDKIKGISISLQTVAGTESYYQFYNGDESYLKSVLKRRDGYEC